MYFPVVCSVSKILCSVLLLSTPICSWTTNTKEDKENSTDDIQHFVSNRNSFRGQSQCTLDERDFEDDDVWKRKQLERPRNPTASFSMRLWMWQLWVLFVGHFSIEKSFVYF
jgi:hypothetical protein